MHNFFIFLYFSKQKKTPFPSPNPERYAENVGGGGGGGGGIRRVDREFKLKPSGRSRPSGREKRINEPNKLISCIFREIIFICSTRCL